MKVFVLRLFSFFLLVLICSHYENCCFKIAACTIFFRILALILITMKYHFGLDDVQVMLDI
jgi:hypothetical protein